LGVREALARHRALLGLALLKSSYFPEEGSGNHIKPECRLVASSRFTGSLGVREALARHRALLGLALLKSSYFPEEDGGNHIKPEVSPKPPKLSNSLFIS
jgi:hypothetical protein